MRYKTSPAKVLRLRIPKDKVDNAADVAAYEERESLRAAKLEGKDGQGGGEASPKPSAGGQKRKREQDETKEKPVLPNVPFSALLEAFAAPSSFEFREGTAAQTTRFADFPAYLWVQMARYTVDKNTYQPVKLKHTVTPPLKLDLSNLKGGGFQEGEVALERTQKTLTLEPLLRRDLYRTLRLCRRLLVWVSLKMREREPPWLLTMPVLRRQRTGCLVTWRIPT